MQPSPAELWPPELRHRMRVLLHTLPITDLHRNQGMMQPELRHYDPLVLAMKMLDLIVESMGMEQEVDRRAVVRSLGPVLSAMDAAHGKEPDAVRHMLMAERVFDSLRKDENPPPRPWQHFPWHPRLSWIADLPLLSDELATFLSRVHEGLVQDRFKQLAPMKYRSLELTGHEKRLARLAPSQLFGSGRLDLRLLGCSDDPLPLVWEEVGSPPTLLIFENASAFSVGRAVLSRLAKSPYGLIAYGSGARIERSLPYLLTIPRQVSRIDYVGDLDRDGLRIALAVQRVAKEAGLPVPGPAPFLHRLMLEACVEFGHPRGWPHRKKRVLSTNSDPELLSFLPAELHCDLAPILAADRRIPEEVIGPQALEIIWQANPELTSD